LIAVTATSDSVVLLIGGTFVPPPTTIETAAHGDLRILVLRGTRGCRLTPRLGASAGSFEIDWDRACSHSSFDARALIDRVVPRTTADGDTLELDGRRTDPDDPRLRTPGPGHHVVLRRDRSGTVVATTRFDIGDDGRRTSSSTSIRIPSAFGP
jgi:hypothetical protein